MRHAPTPTPDRSHIMSVFIHDRDLPADFTPAAALAVDTETMGLNPHRDRLCLVQVSNGDGTAHLVRIEKGQREAPRLGAILSDPAITKLFHFARFDIAALSHGLGVAVAPVYCTKIASKLVRTYTDRHGLKDLCRELLAIDISKQQQSSDWGASELTQAQADYAASDVLHLHALRAVLDERLAREGRMEMAEACFTFLPMRARLDLAGWPETDIFAHS